MKIACVAVVKNEERHIAEWLAYQFALGFDTVVLLDNQSTDRTTEQALRLAETRDVRIVDWHQTTPDYQIRGYEHAARRLAGKFDWLAFFDSDEFLVLDEGLDLKTCLQARHDAAAIAVPWAIFGSSGHQEIPVGLVIENFTRRAAADFGPNQHVKSIIRPARMKSCIGPHMFEMDGAILDLAGRQPAWQMPGVLAAPPDYKMAKLHHYFTRSRAHWDEKMARGYHDLKRAANMFLDYDRNEVFDDSALRFFRNATADTPPPGKVDVPNEAPANEPVSARRSSQDNMAPQALTKTESHSGKVAACLVVKNEEAVILEWIAYHSIIGFDSFLVLDDGSTDRTVEYAKMAALHLDVRVMPWTETGRGKQGIAYEKICRKFADEFAWIAFLDSDEFLVPEKLATIQDLVAAHAGRAGIAIPWAVFGSSGHIGKPSGLIIDNYTSRAPDDFGPNLHVKSIVRPDQVIEGVNPHYFEVEGSYALPNGTAAIWDTPGILRDYAANSGWRVQHYFTRSKSHWKDRMARGQLGSFARTEAEFDDYDRNEIPDITATKYAPRVRALRAKLLGIEITAPPTPILNPELAAIPPAAETRPPAAVLNLALNKAATQSSVSEWSIGKTAQDDASGAVNGIINGRRKFHTALEVNPWWQVDLGTLAIISEVRIHNTTDHTAHRFKNFILSASTDNLSWKELTRKEDDLVVGAAIGQPFIWHAPVMIKARWVRITLLEYGFLHLDQVLVFATPDEKTPGAPPETAAAPARTSEVNPNLIFDLGMSEGNDSAFYLAKGFEVVGVEADIKTYVALRKRFAEPLRTGSITLYNFAAAERDADIVEFFRHDLYQGLSGLSHGRAEFQEGNFSRYLVVTVNWPALIEKHGVPHYLKIDVEGHEGPFLQSMAGTPELPTYASVECQNLSPAEKLFALGYRNFKLIDQQPPGGFRLPNIQREGKAISWPEFIHASGPFGQDLPAGPWLNFEEFKSAFNAAQALKLPTWYDCHAWMPAEHANA